MKEIISKEELDKIMSVKGELKGLALKNYGSFIIKEEGEEGLKKIEDAMKSIGCPIQYNKLKAMSFYPLWWSVATFLLIKRIFDYDEQKFQEMGKFCFKFPNIMRIWAKYLISLNRAVKSAPMMHRMYFNVGDFTVPDYSEEKKYIVIRLKNFPPYPIDFPRIYCSFLVGYYSSIVQVVTGTNTTGKETKCVYWGDDYHEFLMKW